jgi:hypothetical protein
MRRVSSAFLRTDLRRMTRDQFLIGLSLMALGTAFALRFSITYNVMALNSKRGKKRNR